MRKRRKSSTARVAGLILFSALAVFPSTARAYEVLFSTDILGQGYQVRDAMGRFLNRRRVDAHLRLYVYDILPEPKDPDERRKPHPQMYLVTVLRLESGFGSFAGADGQASSTLYEEIPTRPVFQVLYGYLGVTGLVKGWLELKLGRQFHWDAFDAYFFDGLMAEVKTPWYVKLKVWGGARVNGVLPIDSPILLLDGTSPAESPLRWTPAFGVALESRNFKYVKARVAYRRTFSGLDDPDKLAPIYVYPDGNEATDIPRWATAEEKVTAGVFVDLFNTKLAPYGGFAYNIATDRFSRILGGVKTILGRHSVSAEYVRHEPDFDADSIFNIFNYEPFTESRLTYELKITRNFSGYARGTVRFFMGGDEDAYDSGPEKKAVDVGPGGGLGLLYRSHRLTARGDFYYQEGYGGRTFGVDAYVKHALLPGTLDWEARATVVHWDDDLQAYLHGVTAGLALGATWRFHRRMAVHFILEENFGEFYKSDLRLYGMLEVAFCSAGYCPAGAGSM